MKKIIPALALLVLANSALNGQNANFSSKGFHITNDPYFIDCAVKQPDGKFLVSGSFHRFNNKPVANLVRFTSQGELDTTFNVSNGTDHTISAMAASADGSIVLSGNFTQYQKQRVQTPLIRITVNGVLDPTFQPERAGIMTHGISAINVLPDGKILVAGRDVHPGYPAKSVIMRLNKNGSADQSFRINACEDFISGIVPGPDSTIIVHGNFRKWDNKASTGLIRLKSNGDVDAGFVLQGSGLQPIYGNWPSVSQAILMPDSGLLLVGNFDYYSNNRVNKIVKLHKDGSHDFAFNLDPGINVSWIDNLELLSDGAIVISGYATVNGNMKWFIKLKADGSLFSPGASVGPDRYPASFGSKRLLAVGQGEFIAIGAFTGKVGGTDVGVLNRFTANAQPYLDQLLPFSRKGRVVQTVVDSAHRIIVVGNFNQYGEEVGAQHNHIVRLMPDGTLDSGFNASGSNAFIGGVALQQNGQIVVTGSFTELNGKTYKGIGRFNDNGSADLGFNPGAGPDYINMYDVHISQNQEIFVTGSFDRFDNVLHEGVVKLNSNGSVDHAFTTVGLDVHGPQSIITLPDGKVIYGESSDHNVKFFDKPMRIRKVDLQGTPDLSFKPPVMGYTVTKKVRSGAGGAIYWLGTIFHDNNNPTRVDRPLVKLQANGSLDSVASANLPYNLYINDFEVLPDNKIVISCQRIGLYDSLDVVMRLNPDLTVDSSFVPVSLLYDLQHINHDGNGKIIIAGEPKRAFRLENEQMQNIAIITKNGLELQTNRNVVRNILDTALIANASVGATTNQVFSIKNTGSTTMELLDPATAGVSGQNASEFSIETKSVVTSLKPNESMEFTLKFLPTAVGQKSAQIKIPFSDGIQQMYAVSIVASASAGTAVTAVEELDRNSGIRIFPNPLQGTSIHITSGQSVKSYELIDVSGRLIQRGTLNGQGTYIIHLKKDIKGLFFVKLKTDKKEVVTKMISL
ncbi:choice-of-anchor D domain-containing protein [Flavitalea antarctica]